MNEGINHWTWTEATSSAPVRAQMSNNHHVTIVTPGRSPRQVRRERRPGAGGPRGDGGRPLVPAPGLPRQHGQGGRLRREVCQHIQLPPV